jgi:hypothetical protein
MSLAAAVGKRRRRRRTSRRRGHSQQLRRREQRRKRRRRGWRVRRQAVQRKAVRVSSWTAKWSCTVLMRRRMGSSGGHGACGAALHS